MEDKFSISPSRITQAGLGLFAKKSLAKNTRLGHYEGELKTSEEFENLRDTSYTFEVTRKVGNRYKLFYIDAKNKKKSNSLRYINGAKTARQKARVNVKAYQYRGEIYYKTLRKILPGEELLLDYGDSYWV